MDQLMNVIKENLPAMKAEELKKILEEWKELKEVNGYLQEKLAQIRQENLVHKDKEIEMDQREDTVEKREWDMQLREEEMLKREHDLDVELLRIKLLETIKSRDEIFRLTETLMKNPRAIEIIASTTNNTEIGNPGNGYRTLHKNGFTNGTVEHREEKE